LSAEDIAFIEAGEANASNARMNPVRKRIRELLWETDAYIANPSPGGNSLTQRFVFWKTGLDIVETYPLTGVGTGDVQDAFNKQYDINHSPLDKEHRLHTHNQYITLWVSFGIFGLFFFLTMLAHLYIFGNQLEFRFVSQMFTIIMILSMISEDTLETQAGVSLFVFFFSLFWTRQSFEK
jgi:O-antigen ligase